MLDSSSSVSSTGSDRDDLQVDGVRPATAVSRAQLHGISGIDGVEETMAVGGERRVRPSGFATSIAEFDQLLLRYRRRHTHIPEQLKTALHSLLTHPKGDVEGQEKQKLALNFLLLKHFEEANVALGARPKED